MKRNMFGIAAAAALLTVGLAPARAESPETLEAKIPFAFEVGKATLPAGDYRIEPASLGSWALTIHRVDGAGGAIILTEPLPAKAERMAPKYPELVFQKTGDEYRLEEVTGPYLQRELLQPKMERESKRAAMSPMSQERVVVRGS